MISESHPIPLEICVHLYIGYKTEKYEYIFSKTQFFYMDIKKCIQGCVKVLCTFKIFFYIICEYHSVFMDQRIHRFYLASPVRSLMKFTTLQSTKHPVTHISPDWGSMSVLYSLIHIISRR